MHAQMQARDGGYDIRDVADALVEKLVRRHPHVFGDSTATTSAEVLAQWDAIKGKEKEKRSALGGVSNSMPALMLAMEVSKRAARVGFE
ncbi:MazG nucleotide pyrophosphohydrolase domain-containing protein, partial [Acinetobacter baumannii]